MTTETNQLPNFSKTENFQSTMSSLNYGHVMEQAARDYQREMLLKEEKEGDASRRRNNNGVVVNLNEDDDEAFVERMQKKRLEELKNGTRMRKRRDAFTIIIILSFSLSLSLSCDFLLCFTFSRSFTFQYREMSSTDTSMYSSSSSSNAAQKLRFEMERLGHGSYSPVEEKDFLSAVTSSHLCVVHFSLDEFERCKILHKHLQSLSQKYFKTRFMKANAPDLPFFTEKLNVKVLPCLILFKNGIAFDRIVGFEDFGNTDDYKTMALEKRLLEAGVIEEEEKDTAEEEKGDEQIDKEEVMRELANRRMKRGFHKTDSDEDSDFD
jgi:thiol-disulfide isomerase/thioredoxin